MLNNLDNHLVRVFSGTDRTGLPLTDPEATLELAVENLRSFDHVGVVHRSGAHADMAR